MTTLSDNEKRRTDRISLSLSAVVKAKQSREEFWTETINLISISRSGAGFYLQKECQIGQLLSLLMPMPRHLRCYDRDKELYRVWGLIQHCSPVSGNDKSSFHVGVAFVGKQVPPSYTENPLQSYRISGMNEDGTWRIVEAQTSFVVRRHPRFWIPLEVSLSALDEQENIISDESAEVENISLSGAAVFSELNIDVGESVKFNCQEYDFSALAIVRNRQMRGFDLPRLHFEFIDAEFPIEKVMLPNEAETIPAKAAEPLPDAPVTSNEPVYGEIAFDEIPETLTENADLPVEEYAEV